jgi:hypothetical protein
MARPWPRFHTPPIEPDRQISRIRLSDKTSRLHPRHVVPKPAQAYEPKVSVKGAFVASVANAQTPCDGMWSVMVQTRARSCDPTGSYAVTVTDGKVSGPANVSGTVTRSGNVRVSIGAAYASGQLEGNEGSGKWNAASGGVPCSGRCEALRGPR